MRSILKQTIFATEVHKSKFIAIVLPVDDAFQIPALIDTIRRQHPGANHYCYAYVLGRSGEQQRYSDDGEPSRTAGLPMLELLLHANATNVLAVVVRYFGGTLLGTGGLVRSYQGALKGALESVVWTEEASIAQCLVSVEYADVFGLEGLLRSKTEGMRVDYEDKLVFRFEILETELSTLQEAVAKETHYQSRFIVESRRRTYRES